MKRRLRIAIVLTILASASSVLEAQWVKTAISGYPGVPICIDAPKNIYVQYNDNSVHQFLRSDDDGTTWKNIYSQNFDSVSNGGSVSTVTEAGGFIIAEVISGSDYSGIYRSADNALSWQRADGAGFAVSTIVKFYAFDSLIIGVEGSGGLLSSTDYGNNWRLIYPSSSGGSEDRRVSGVVWDQQILYFGIAENHGFGNWQGNIFRSRDMGNTWDTIHNSFSGYAITAFAMNNGWFYAEAGLLNRSRDIEKNWQNITYDALAPGIQFLSFSGENVFAGLVVDSFASGTIFWSPNNGDLWRDNTDNLHGYKIYNLFAHGEYVFAETDHAVWRRRISEFSKVHYPDLKALGISLIPNPMAGVGTVYFNLVQSAYAKIEIVNSLGQIIQTLDDRFEDQGTHTITFDLSHFPTGEYFCMYRLGDSLLVRSVHLIR
ncbi:MAG: T9SS type A sorting domain-containing protein [Bacteroidota bacterium]|nr:T9SS type A sorting domain-containing protein [Bacteroidota bacterium]MDP4231598.1 T9SS type A sorting domain-containing protein [Bacteroidota bacterium]MDP4235154.1 T9SS type A sorting domain-containing protein [Bacteroidota bacterium]